MKSFEHCNITVEFDSTSYRHEVTSAVTQTIQEYDSLGWELVCVAHEGEYKRVLYFKRERVSYEKV
jgi:hypothetical protein